MYRQSEKKLVKQQYLLNMSSQYGEPWPLTAEIGSGVWGTPASKFQRLSRLAFVTAVKLCTMFGRLLGWYTVYTFPGALAH